MVSLNLGTIIGKSKDKKCAACQTRSLEALKHGVLFLAYKMGEPGVALFLLCHACAKPRFSGFPEVQVIGRKAARFVAMEMEKAERG